MASKASITLPWGCWASGVGCPAWPESTLTAALWAARAQREMWAAVGFPAPLSEDFRSASLKGWGFPAVTAVRIHLQCRRHVRSGFGPRVGKIPREEEMATHSSILAWTIPWTEEPGGLRSWGCKESDKTEQLSTHAQLKGLHSGQ